MEAYEGTEQEQTALPPEMDTLIQALAKALSGLSIQLDGEAVGRLVCPTVDSELGRAAYNHRYE